VSKIPPSRVVALLEPRLGAVRELDEPRPLEQLILLLLARGGTLQRARKALKTLQADYVDWNDVRVTSARELAEKIGEATGVRVALERAEKLVELLSMVYHRFNRLNLDFLQDPSLDEGGKKRTRLFAWLGERSALWPAMLTLHASKKRDVLVDVALLRVLARLGVVDLKATASSARQRLLEIVPDDLLVTFQFVLHVLAEEVCHQKAPDCGHCSAKAECPSAATFLKAAAAEAKKSAAKEAPAAKKKPARAKARS
jgi:endonuclease III